MALGTYTPEEVLFEDIVGLEVGLRVRDPSDFLCRLVYRVG